MNRSDFQKLSKLRLKEARILLQSKSYEGAYYLAGYAVECAIKACIARQVKRFDFPDKKFVNDSYTHDIDKLIGVSGLKTQLNTQLKTNAAFSVNWAIIKDWSEQQRYSLIISRTQARDLYSAISARRHGVMSWLKKLW